MADKHEGYDVYAIPRNFGEDGTTFGGLNKRNVFEAAGLALVTGYPIVKWTSFTIEVKLILLCFICIPLVIFGLVGMNGESLTQFIQTFFRFLIKRRVLTWYVDGGEDELEPIPSVVDPEKTIKRKYLRQKQAKKKKSPKNAGKDGHPPAPPAPESKVFRKIKNMVQEYLPVEDIRNGMIITTDKRFIKIVEVHPINFLLRSASEQRDIILSFSELLRISPVKLQIKCIANKADTEKFIKSIEEAMAREENEKCIEMDMDYIEHIRTVGNNQAVTRRFFVIFEFENGVIAYSPTELDIQFALESTVRNFKSYLGRCGNSIEEFVNLKEENEQLVYLFFLMLDNYNILGETTDDKVNDAFKRRLKVGSMEQMRINDYICPREVDFSHKKYIVIDGVYHAYLYIPSDGYRTLVQAGWLSPLINAGEAIDVDLYLQKQPSDIMQQKVSRNLRMNKARMNEVATTSADYNKLGDIMESGYYLQRGLSDGQEFYYLNVIITIKAFSKKDLDIRVSEVVKMMTAKQVSLKPCNYMQEGAFQSTLPLAKLGSQMFRLGKRNVLSAAAASTYMFTAFEMCDENGILLGTNEHNNSLVVMDIFNSKKYKNANLICMGTSGAGKSFTIQTIATRLRRLGIQTFIIAPLKGHEFIRCCKAIGGQYIKLSTGSPHCINILEIRKMDTSLSELLDEEEEQQSYLSKKIDSLLVFFSLLMPELTNVEEQLLDEAILNTYAEKGITTDNESLIDPENSEKFKTMPILEDLYNQLLKEPKAGRVAIILKRFVSGSAKAFNAQTNVDLNKYCVFDISQLKGRMLSVGMFICLDLIWDKARENRIESKAIIIDELWNLIGGSASTVAAEFVFECWKIARGYSCSAIGCTQDIEDFFSLENGKYGKALLNNSKTKIILNLEPHEAEMVQEVLRLTDTEIHKIKNFERGHGIISTNSNNIAVSFKASQTELELITTDKSELQRIAREKEQRKAAAAMFGETVAQEKRNKT